MKTTVKLLTLLLAVAILASAVACGAPDMEESLLLKNKYCKVEPEQASADEMVLLSNIFNDLQYTPEMLYGYYQNIDFERYEDSKSKLKNYCSEVGTLNYVVGNIYGKIAAIPYSFVAGPESLSSSLNSVKGYNWARAYFATEEGRSYTMYCAYEVNGDQMTIKPLKNWNKDSETGEIKYEFEEVDSITYRISHRGFKLTLSVGGHTATLYNGLNSKKERYFYCHVCPSTPADSLYGIDNITLSYDGDSGHANYQLEGEDTYSRHEVAVKMDSDGRATVTGILNEITGETFCKEFGYLFCGSDGVILFKDGKQYRYQLDSYTRKTQGLSAFMEVSDDESEGDKTELSDDKIEELEEKKDNLIADLGAAFEQAGLSVRVDEETGEMAMDANILFDGDSAELKDAGKELLDKFIGAYTKVVTDEKYKGFVSTTRVEGHTAPVAGVSFEAGMPLSQERARAVRDYCLANPDAASLASSMQAIGMSNGNPVVDAEGNVDMAASRRVAFRFLINMR